MGESTSIDLGRFQGNALAFVSVSFEALSATIEDLKDDVSVTGSFDPYSQKVSLKIDLSNFESTLAGSSVSGEL